MAAGSVEHVCVPHRTPEEGIAATIPFVRRALERRFQLVYLAEDPRSPALLRALEGAGLPAGDAGRSGAISIVGRSETYLNDAPFDPQRMLAWLRARADAAVRAGFAGFAYAAEVIAVIGPAGGERFPGYEAKLQGLAATEHLSVLCHYDRGRLPGVLLRDALWTHPQVVVNAVVCRNPLFVPPEAFLAGETTDEVQRLLEMVVHEERAQDDRRDLTRRVQEAQEGERRALARDLHDDLGQILAAVHLRLQTNDDSPEAMAVTSALVVEAMEYVRSIGADLRQPLLDDLGLAPALRSLARLQAMRGGFEVHVDVEALPRDLPQDVVTTCYRVVQEALTNVVRHADARHVEVRLSPEGGALSVVVRDEGRGFDVGATDSRAVGLLGMRERVATAGGVLEVESTSGRGTTIRARIPLTRGR